MSLRPQLMEQIPDETVRIARRCRTAPKHGHVAALDDFVNMHLAAKPGMPWIKNFPYLGPMSVVLLRCTTPANPIRALTGKHPTRPTSPRFRRPRRLEPGSNSTYQPKNLFRQTELPHQPVLSKDC
jgi:hypothetical protein